MIRIAADTNVLISALLFGGKPQMILEKAISGQVGLVVSRDTVNEIEGVLCGKKFTYPPEIARSVVREFEAMCEIVTPARKRSVVQADPNDNMILECAVEARVDYVVSGDSHLFKPDCFEEIPTLSPTQFLDILER